jgi:hypothetical protein
VHNPDWATKITSRIGNGCTDIGILKPNSTLIIVPSKALREAIIALLGLDGETTVSAISGVDLGD